MSLFAHLDAGISLQFLTRLPTPRHARWLSEKRLSAWLAAAPPRPVALLNADQGEHTERMARSVLCMIGLHRWLRRRNEDGQEYTECSRCGTYNVTPQEGGTLPPMG